MDTESAMGSGDDVVFYGLDGAECERFIRLVRRKAFQNGKLDDQVWMARYASTCFDGDALRWFVDLDRGIQTDWELLSRALIRQYPKDLKQEPESRCACYEYLIVSLFANIYAR